MCARLVIEIVKLFKGEYVFTNQSPEVLEAEILPPGDE
jgi:hypothetical protein